MPYNAFLQHQKWANHLFFMVLLLGTTLLLNTPVTARAATQVKKVDDIRVLIDISGSMKRTDPDNLRIPALRLFSTLLPVGSEAGVWTFGQWVNSLVPHGKVDGAWKEVSLKNITQINSSGLFTNIEQALAMATADWQQGDENTTRNVLLLSDGLVDISREAQQNQASRKKILQEMLPRLAAQNVKINTIALSAESDRELLHQLASATGGWFETIENADRLERLFLKMFEKVAQADSLPLKDNIIKIDNNIQEVTFLVFRKNDDAISLTSPSKKTITRELTSPQVSWYQDKRFELITIRDPEVGSWKLNADIDADNRAMVVTNLQLETTQLPNSIEAGAPINFQVHLEEDGKIIDRKEFLNFVRVKLQQENADGKVEFKTRLKDNGKDTDEKKNDGIFSIELKDSLAPGEYDIEVIVNGTTFKRNKRQKIKIFDDPVSVSLKQAADGTYTLSVVPYKSLIDSNAMVVLARHILPSGEKIENKVPRVSPAEWRSSINPAGIEGKHELVLHILGNRPDGSQIDSSLPAKSFIVGKSTPVKEIAETHQQQPTDEPVNWLMVSLKIGVFNTILLVLAFLMYKFFPALKEIIIPSPTRDLAHG